MLSSTSNLSVDKQ
jgi:hypothetical protein